MSNISNPAGGDKQLWMYKMVALYKENCFYGCEIWFLKFWHEQFRDA